MLNELLSIERGLAAAGIATVPRHPDINDVGKGDIIRVRLDRSAVPVSLELIDAQSAHVWTLRDGKKNSFPFVKTKPLLAQPDDTDWRSSLDGAWKQWARHEQRQEQRQKLRELYGSHGLNEGWIDSWPEPSLRTRLLDRLQSFERLRNTEAAAVPAVIDRFLLISERPKELFAVIARLLLGEVEEGAETWIETAKQFFLEGGRLYFDVVRREFPRDVGDASQVQAISLAISGADGDRQAARCALTGDQMPLLSGNFPQPKLPLLGPTYLFSRNKDIPAAYRYGRYADKSLDVGEDVVKRLDAALRELTAEHREGVSWSKIPGEVPKQSDLLLAFVEAALDAPVAKMLGGERVDADESEQGEGEAAFETRTERVIEAARAKVGQDFRKTPVQICVLRRVDPANRKAIYHRQLTVGALYDSATAWSEGLKNLPAWLTLPAPGKGEKRLRRRAPPRIEPLHTVEISRRNYIRGGTEHSDSIALSAAEVMSIFLGETHARRIRSTLALLVRRYGELLSGCAQALRKSQGAPKKYFDHVAALRALAVLGVLLHKLGHCKEVYMNDRAANAAFRLGQFLAAADVVHAGYCADMRKGQVPPTLIGNSVLAMAQSSPTKALAVLSRRWKPYGAWARGGAASKVRKKPREQWRDNEWAILRGASHARRLDELGRDLHEKLPETADDAFRAELLLGYVAGLPPLENEDEGATQHSKAEE